MPKKSETPSLDESLHIIREIHRKHRENALAMVIARWCEEAINLAPAAKKDEAARENVCLLLHAAATLKISTKFIELLPTLAELSGEDTAPNA